MNSADRSVRHAIYQHFIERGRAPRISDLSRATGMPDAEVVSSLDRLASAHRIALVPGTRAILMAAPFSAVPTAYPVEAEGMSWFANCAWDALGIPTMLGVDARTRTACPDCGEQLEIVVEDGIGRSKNGGVVHFGVPVRRFWDDIGFT